MRAQIRRFVPLGPRLLMRPLASRTQVAQRLELEREWPPIARARVVWPVERLELREPSARLLRAKPISVITAARRRANTRKRIQFVYRQNEVERMDPGADGFRRLWLTDVHEWT